MPQDSTTEKGRKSSSIDGKVGSLSNVAITIHIYIAMHSCIHVI